MRTHYRCAASLAAALLVVVAGAALAADKPAKKAPSVCAGLASDACAGKTECSWYKQITLKNGKTRKAHCRKKPSHTASASKPA